MKGFTLVELLVALFLLALLSSFAYRSVNVLMVAEKTMEQDAAHFDSLQKAMLFIERDISQMASIENNNTVEDSITSFLVFSPESVDLTGVYSGLIKVSYFVDDGGLYRHSQVNERMPLLDSAQEIASPVRLLSGVDNFSLQRLEGNSATNAGAAGNTPQNIIGMQLTLSHTVLGEMQRYFYVGIKYPEKSFASLKAPVSGSGQQGNNRDNTESAGNNETSTGDSSANNNPSGIIDRINQMFQ